MAGRRLLSRIEGRQLPRAARKLNRRDRVLITAQWLAGCHIHEVLALTIRLVWLRAVLSAIALSLSNEATAEGLAEAGISSRHWQEGGAASREMTRKVPT